MENKMVHCPVSIKDARRIIKWQQEKGYECSFMTPDLSRSLTFEEAENKFNWLEEQGYKVAPCCKNVNDKGYCQGAED